MIKTFLNHLLTMNFIFLVVPLVFIYSFTISYSPKEVLSIVTTNIFEKITEKTSSQLQNQIQESLPEGLKDLDFSQLTELEGFSQYSELLGDNIDMENLDIQGLIDKYKDQLLDADLSTGELNLALPANLLNSNSEQTVDYNIKLPFTFNGSVKEAFSKAYNIGKITYYLTIFLTILLLFIVAGTSIKSLISHLSTMSMVVGIITMLTTIVISQIKFINSITELTPVFQNAYTISSVILVLSTAGLLFTHMPQEPQNKHLL